MNLSPSHKGVPFTQRKIFPHLHRSFHPPYNHSISHLCLCPVQLHASPIMEYKSDATVEIQKRESDSSEEIFSQSNALIDDWDSPSNKENPRNWSGCESYALTRFEV